MFATTAIQDLKAHSALLLGFSGGPDSCLLLHLLVEKGFNVHAVHVNHLLREEASEADEQFCRDTCAALGIPIHVHRERPETAPGISLEMAGRALRHRVFREQLNRNGAQGVALGHHRDDNVETILMRRERHPDEPLADMQAYVEIVRNGQTLRLFRPLLDWPKAEILAELERRRIPFRLDASNADTSFARNRIRHEIVATMSEAEKAELVGEARDLRTSFAAEVASAGIDVQASRILIAPFLAQPKRVRRAIALHWLGHEHPRVAMALAEGRTTELPLATGDRLRREGQWFVVAPPCPTSAPPLFSIWLPEQGSLNVGPWTLSIEPATGFNIERRPFEAWLPRGRYRFRNWEHGDTMAPFGMVGTRKLQDIFTDLKTPRHQRAVLEDESGRIAWVPGYRISKNHTVAGEAPSTHLSASV